MSSVASPPRTPISTRTARGDEDLPDYRVEKDGHAVEMWVHGTLDDDQRGIFIKVNSTAPGAETVATALRQSFKKLGAAIADERPLTGRFSPNDTTFFVPEKELNMSPGTLLTDSDKFALFIGSAEAALDAFAQSKTPLKPEHYTKTPITSRPIASQSAAATINMIARQAVAKAYSATYGTPEQADPAIDQLAKELTEAVFSPKHYPHYQDGDRQTIAAQLAAEVKIALGDTETLRADYEQLLRSVSAKLADAMKAQAQTGRKMTADKIPGMIQGAAFKAYTDTYDDPAHVPDAVKIAVSKALSDLFPGDKPANLAEIVNYMTDEFIADYLHGASRPADNKQKFLKQLLAEAQYGVQENAAQLRGDGPKR